MMVADEELFFSLLQFKLLKGMNFIEIVPYFEPRLPFGAKNSTAGIRV